MGDKASIQAPIIASTLRRDVPGLRVMVHAGAGNFKNNSNVLIKAMRSSQLLSVKMN